ncbi:hypothetical protein QBC42DRAFT_330359 [Cladorrhinum samala]|uniref:Ankyrin repeat protein n=1 Tax=Cladorrhinum samala TaxID=585594 RepID=A0AAV9HKG0_9PEZI|nr:hypothetical protein QBC42DRAFT_330359 [Cladorrhinum samala]
MQIKPHEAHHIAVLAGQGETAKLKEAVNELAQRETASPAGILIACKDDFQQTAAHIAAKSGQTKSILTLAELLESDDKKSTYFNMANRFTGDRPVHTAMRHGYLDVLKALVSNGADPTAKNRFGDMVVDYPGDYEPEEVQRVVEEYRDKMDKARG